MKHLISLLILSITACASAPTQEQQSSANYGAVQSQDQCVALAEDAVKLGLKDPDSAKFKHSTCIKGWMSSVPLLGLKAKFGYFLEGSVNAKNSFGAYVGYSNYMVLVKDGVVIRYCITDSDGLCLPKF